VQRFQILNSGMAIALCSIREMCCTVLRLFGFTALSCDDTVDYAELF
jgi:hypothetical protein